MAICGTRVVVVVKGLGRRWVKSIIRDCKDNDPCDYSDTYNSERLWKKR